MMDIERQISNIVPNEKENPPFHEKRENELVDQAKSVYRLLWAFKEAYKHLDSEGKTFYGHTRAEVAFLEKYDLADLEKIIKIIARVLPNGYGGASNVREYLQTSAKENPELEQIYKEILRELVCRDHKKVRDMLNQAVDGKTVNPEVKKQLDQRTIELGKELSPEQVRILQENFPSGNYLVHTTGIKTLISVAESGVLMSKMGLAKKNSAGQGGLEGISFNMNAIRILIGDKAHFAGFVASPESVLKKNNKLVIPYYAAMNEVQLVARQYKNRVQSEMEADYGILPPDYELGYPEEDLPEVDAGDVFIFCSQSDVEAIKALFSSVQNIPRGFVTYPTHELRVESWEGTSGDHNRASNLLVQAFTQAGLKPSIDWEKDVLTVPADLKYDKFVPNYQVDKSNSIIQTEKGLELTNPEAETND